MRVTSFVQFMIGQAKCVPEKASYNVGKGVYNKRVERFWRDAYYGVTGLYYQLFRHWEEIDKLFVNNEARVWALRYTFVPRINHGLRSFADG